MQTVSIRYTVKNELNFAPHYVWLSDNSCFNIRTGRKIKQVLVSGCIGYCIDGKFRSLTIKTQRKPTYFSRWMNLVNNFV